MISRVSDQNGVSQAWYRGFPTRMVYLKHDIEGSQPEWCISSMISRVPNQNGVSQAWYRGFPTRMVYLKHDIEGSRPEWCISSMISRVPDQNGVSQAWYRGFPTRMVYLKHDIEGFRPEWCISSMISRVSDQNGVSQAWYRGFPTRMVYLYYISCLRYPTLVGNPRYIVEIHHSGRKPSRWTREMGNRSLCLLLSRGNASLVDYRGGTLTTDCSLLDYNNNNNNNNCSLLDYNNNDDNNIRIQRCYSRFFTISSQGGELSPTCTLKWPGRNRVQIRATRWALFTCKCHVTCHTVRRDSSATKFDRVEITFIWALFYWLNH